MAKDQRQIDEQLLNSWKNGNDRAFTEIYERNFAKVKLTLIKKLGISDEMAEHMFDEAMMVLDGNRSTFLLTCKLSTYLTTIALNKSIDELRRKPDEIFGSSVNLEDLLLSVSLNLKMENDAAGWNEAIFTYPEYDDVTEAEDKIIQKALRLIDGSVCAKILMLRYWENLRLKDIAQRLNRNESYIRRKIEKCREKLKNIIENLEISEL